MEQRLVGAALDHVEADLRQLAIALGPQPHEIGAALKGISLAVKKGELRPGGVIVEGTAGNTGIGLALVANARGYRTGSLLRFHTDRCDVVALFCIRQAMQGGVAVNLKRYASRSLAAKA